MASRTWLLLNLKLATLLRWTLVAALVAFSDCVYYADNGLEQTLAYKFLPAKERREMQQEILNLLGLQHRPKPKSHGTDNSAPKYLQDLYKSLLDEESGNLKVDEKKGPVIIEGEVLSKMSLHAINDSDVIMSFINQFAHRYPHSRHEREKRFWFDISELEPSQNIMEAELRLFRNLSSSRFARDTVFNLSIYVLLRGDDREDRRLLLVDQKTIAKDHGWIMFNVTEPMNNWVAFSSRNLGLYLSIKNEAIDRELSAHEIGIVASRGRRDRQPFMLAFIQTPLNSIISHRRVTREAKKPRTEVSSSDLDTWNPYLNAKDRYSGRSCQKKTLYVSFRDLGWQDWIIAPDGYAAFFCDGECSFPLNAHMNATNHAIVQTLVHLMNPHIVPKPCCAPTKLSAIMVLYFDDNSNVILKKYKNMVVKSCGCH